MFALAHDDELHHVCPNFPRFHENFASHRFEERTCRFLIDEEESRDITFMVDTLANKRKCEFPYCSVPVLIKDNAIIRSQEH